jgi:glucuronosyltransferase
MSGSLLLFVALALSSQAMGANILFLSGVASPSHHIYNRALVVGLAENHNITFVSGDVSNKKHPNIHYIHLEKTYDIIYEGDEPFDAMTEGGGPIGFFEEVQGYFLMNCQGNLVSKGLETILNYPDNFKFDLVIHDITCGPCLLPLVHKFKYPPLVSITAFSIPPYTLATVGGHKYPAYIPHYNLNYPVEMTFFQRFYNTFIYAYEIL